MTNQPPPGVSPELVHWLADQAPDLIFRLRVAPDLQFEYLNQAVTAISGYTPEEFYTDPGLCLAIVHPEDRDEVAVVLASPRGAPAGLAPVRWIRKDGRLVWVEFHLSCQENERGELFLNGVARDITRPQQDVESLRRISERIQKAEQRNRAMLAALPDLMFVLTRDGDYVDFKSERAEDLALPPDEIIGKNIRQAGFLQPYLDLYYDAIAKALDTGQVQCFEYDLTVPKGLATWEARIAPLDVGQVLVIVREITARKRAEAQLRLQADMLAVTANAILISDAQGVVEWVNQAFERLTGYSKEEIVGQTPRLLKSGRHDEAFYRQMWAAIRAGRVWQGETTNRKKDGSLYVEEQTITPLRSLSGEITHFVSVKQDVTARRRREQELEVMVDIAAALRTANTRTEMIDALLDRAMALMNASGAAYWSLEASGLPEVGGTLESCGTLEASGALESAGAPETGGTPAPAGAPEAPGMRDTSNPQPARADHFHVEAARGAAAAMTGRRIPAGLTIPIHNLAGGQPFIAGSGEVHLPAAVPAAPTPPEAPASPADPGAPALAAALPTAAPATAASTASAAGAEPDSPAPAPTRGVAEARAFYLPLAPDPDPLPPQAAGAPPPNGSRAAAAPRPTGPGLPCTRMAAPGQPWPGFAESGLPQPHLPGCRCAAGVPLVTHEEQIGALLVGREQPYDAHDLRLLTAMADAAASAIQRLSFYEQMENSKRELEIAYESTLEGWALALELRDRETEGHTRRVTAMALRLAETMGLRGEALRHFRRGTLLHDIGKMAIPDPILQKQGPLTEEEWAIMRLHPVFARNLLASIPFLKEAIDIPYAHHEHWDGSGYPLGLKGTEIPLTARIFAVVDVWDALRSDRPYRPAWPVEETLGYIERCAGKQFDPAVVRVFLAQRPWEE